MISGVCVPTTQAQGDETLTMNEVSTTEESDKEDRYVEMLEKQLKKKQVYGGKEYVYIAIGGIKSDEINTRKLLKKFENVVDKYNEKSQKLKIIMQKKVLNDHYMQIDVKSINVESL